jgi:hypothetical protein
LGRLGNLLVHGSPVDKLCGFGTDNGIVQLPFQHSTTCKTRALDGLVKCFTYSLISRLHEKRRVASEPRAEIAIATGIYQSVSASSNASHSSGSGTDYWILLPFSGSGLAGPFTSFSLVTKTRGGGVPTLIRLCMYITTLSN